MTIRLTKDKGDLQKGQITSVPWLVGTELVAAGQAERVDTPSPKPKKAAPKKPAAAE